MLGVGLTQWVPDERWDVYCNSSLTVRVTIDVVVAVGHGMVTRCVSEEAAE